MFKTLNLKPFYTSENSDIADSFYNPILKVASKYDRTSGYFSSKALSLYAKGLEHFATKNNKFRLIISQNISNEDYELIKKGYFLKSKIQNKLNLSLDEKLTLTEENRLSNLAFLISQGIVEIKFAFTKNGIFHEKMGIFYDANNNIITFVGSNNETESAFKNNYESFYVHLSWIKDQTNFYNDSISRSIQNFEKLWNNDSENVLVLEAEKTIKEKILKFNKNKIIFDELYLSKNTIFFDVDNNVPFLKLNLDNNKIFKSSPIFKIYIKDYLNYYDEVNNIVVFRDDVEIEKLKNISQILTDELKKIKINFIVTNKFLNYINEFDLLIKQRCKLGISIKRKEPTILKKFEIYKEKINKLLSRTLKEKQIWDSFFMTSMIRSCNFSVPGSGKTSSVLGTFAYLRELNKISKIVIIGPKNCFKSWKDEFKKCFNNKIILKYFDAHENTENPINDNYNMYLFNYEILDKYIDKIIRISKENNCLLVFDEIHRIKKIDSKRFLWAKSIVNDFKYRIALTGTPIPNTYLDIFNILNILFDKDYNSYFGFSKIKLKNTDEFLRKSINKKIYPFFCRTSKQDLQIPEPQKDLLIKSNSNISEIELFKIIYQKSYKNKFSFYTRILQLESNPHLLLKSINKYDLKSIINDWDENEILDFQDDKYDKYEKLINSIEITSKKIKCIELIKDLVLLKNKKVIVWCIFVDSMLSIQELLANQGINAKSLYGETDSQTRDSIIENFKLKKIDVLLTNPHTLAESVSLHEVCSDAIYFEFSFNLVHLLQSKDRIHRLGIRNNNTQWYFLINDYDINGVKYSLNEIIYNRLTEKEKIMLTALNQNSLEYISTIDEDLDFLFDHMKFI
ncbi:SNF2-related protein [Mycoplasmoides pirum]|uniref:SNF2-related protein n=1 Tax=Mycoplasmoides pirum TaxID=2122 RepID=UPI00047FB878|nr:SNF2-related protein [Mycoplasmoides pirum]